MSSLLLLLLLLHKSSSTNPPISTIYRTSKQQILSTIPPNPPQPSQLLLISPSSKFSAFFLRTAASPTDFCLIQIQTSTSTSPVWESHCTPVSSSNSCSLVFDDDGLSVFDGNQPAWTTDSNGFHPSSLQLLDIGDMRIIDESGELAWKASDEPQTDQDCAFLGSTDSPPFADRIGGSGEVPFGLPAAAPRERGREDGGWGEGKQTEPLVDNTPYDSGSLRGVKVALVGFGALALLFEWIVM